jgi:hypothetical protein
MNRRTVLLCGAMLAAAGIAFLVPGLSAARDAADKTPWKIVGQLEEACSCSKACPCWFDSKPTKMNCSGNQVLFIEKGNYGNVKLDGLAMANYVQSPDGKGMMESFGKWNMSYLYIDEKANPEQKKALEAVGNTVFPMAGAPEDKRLTKTAAIKRTVTGKTHKIEVGQYGTVTAHLIEGGLGGSAKITNPPGADPLHKEYLQGETESMNYTDAAQNWNFQGSNYMFGTFELDNVMYEKYMAGLSQKMQAQPK